MIHPALYDPFETMEFSEHNCFLCGRSTNQQQPVFPKWLTSRYNLSDKQLLLLDKSIITYPELTIPVCNICYSGSLEPLERTVEEAVTAGPEAIKALNETTWFKWMGKIFYGILINELQREKMPLLKPEYPLSENQKMLLKFQSFFKVLQAIRLPIQFDDFVPYSMFKLPAADEGFAYEDELTTMMFSIRLEGVELVCCLLDNGIIRRAMGRVYEQVKEQELHPAQIAEFKARVYYAAYLLNVIPEYFARNAKDGSGTIIFDTLIDDVTASVFNPWENPAYTTMLEKMWARWQVSRAEILENPQQPLSVLFNAEGQFIPANAAVLNRFSATAQ